MNVPPHDLVADPLRLAALYDYDVLDTAPEEGFDDLAFLAAQACATSVALVSLVDRDRQWFKARVDFPPCETDLDSSVCRFTLAEPDILQITDLAADPRTRDNPLVTGEPFIRFYAGAPLRTAEGRVLGSLCVIDKAPRPGGLTDMQADALRRFARHVMGQLELRRVLRAREALQREQEAAFRAREAVRDAQAAVVAADGDLDGILGAVVRGAMWSIPAADGGVVELLDGDALEYRAARGSLAPHVGLRLSVSGSLAGHCVATRRPQLMADALEDPHVRRDLIGRLALRSAVVTPIMRGEAVLGVLKLQSSSPGAFAARDLELLGLFAGVATSGLAQAAARAEVRAKDVYWRGLFDRLSEGFIVAEVVRDTDGRVADWRYLEVNPAWGELVGIDRTTVIGRTIREVLPDIEDDWVKPLAQVVETGQAVAFTRRVGTLRRWYDGRAFPLGGDRFGVLFLDATGRVEAEGRGAALLALGDRLRDLTTVAEMTRAASEIVGRTLGATRAGFGRIDGDIETIDVEPDWTAPGIASIAGRHRYDDYGDVREHLRRGEALVIDDVAADARVRDDIARWRDIHVGSLVNMPVRERGRTVAVFIVHDVKARAWTPDELAFLRNVADRVEVGVARLRAEEQQAVLNRELSHRLKNTLAVVQAIGSQTLRGVAERHLVEAYDRRILALSRAHDALMHRNWSAARLRTVIEGVLTLQADLDRFAFDGPGMDVSAEAAMSLSLLLHELATNALKYGALSAPGGTVRIAWRTEPAEGAPVLALSWAEGGGPPVRAPSGRTGFGSKLIRMGLLGTRETVIRYDPSGLRAEFRAPLDRVQVQ